MKYILFLIMKQMKTYNTFLISIPTYNIEFISEIKIETDYMYPTIYYSFNEKHPPQKITHIVTLLDVDINNYNIQRLNHINTFPNKIKIDEILLYPKNITNGVYMLNDTYLESMSQYKNNSLDLLLKPNSLTITDINNDKFKVYSRRLKINKILNDRSRVY